ncbi:MAG: hypothetical protein ACRC62_15705 [Microcoleus sp.]
MANDIVPIKTTATNIPGVELVYLEDRDLAGINQKGFARLLGCDNKTAANVFQGVNQDGILELEMQTEGGFQGVKFATEEAVIEALEIVMDGRFKAETKATAREIYRRFAKAGFKLGVMLNVAPEALKTKVDRHIAELQLQELRNEGLRLEVQKETAIASGKQADLQLVQFRHIVTSTMPEAIQQKVLGYSEIKTIEYRDRVLHNDDLISDGSTLLKSELCDRYGIKTRNGKPDYKRLNEVLTQLPSEAFDLTVRLQDNYELRREWLPQLDRIVREGDRGLFLGE